MSDVRTRPPLRCTNAVIGLLAPAGNARSSARNLSTLSVCFLKELVGL